MAGTAQQERAERRQLEALTWKRRPARDLGRWARPVERWLRKRLLLAIDRLALREPVRPDPDRVVIVCTEKIGNFVLWLHAAQAIVEFYHGQGKHVTLLASSAWKNWAAEFGIFDEVLGLDERRFQGDLRYRLAAGKRIRELGFGTAVRPAYTRVLEGNDSLVRLSGALERVGPCGAFDTESQGDGRVSDTWYTRLLPSDRNSAAEMHRSAAFVRQLTGGEYSAQLIDLRRSLHLQLRSELQSELKGRPYFVLFPGVSFAGGVWPAERFVVIASRLARATGWVGVICGDRSEAPQASQMCDEAAIPLLNWVDRTDWTQLAAVLAGAEVLIGNETCAVHIAAAAGTPAVCVLGGGQYGRFVPYPLEQVAGHPLPIPAVNHMDCFGCDWKCRFHPLNGSAAPCTEDIPVEAVWAAVIEALQQRAPRQEKIKSVPRAARTADLQGTSPLVLLH